MPKRRTQKLSDKELRERISKMPAQFAGAKKSLVITMLMGTGFLAWFQNLIFPVEFKPISEVFGWLLFGFGILWTLVLVPGNKETRLMELKNPSETVCRLQIRSTAIRFYFWRGGVIALLGFGLSLVNLATLSHAIPIAWATCIAIIGPSFAIALSLWKQPHLLQARIRGWPFESWWSKALMRLLYILLGLIVLLKAGVRLVTYYDLPTEKLALFVGIFLVYATAFIQPQGISDFLIARIQRKIQKEEMAANEKFLESTLV